MTDTPSTLNHLGRRRSVSLRFAGALIAVISLLLAGFAIVVALSAISDAEAKLENKLNAYLTLAQSALPSPVWNFDTATVDDFVQALREDDEVVFAAVVSESTELSRDSVPELGFVGVSSLASRTELLASDTVLRRDGEEIGRFYMAITREGIRDEAIASVLQIAMITVIIIGAIALVSVIVANRFVAKPLAKIEEIAGRVALGELETPVKAESNDELGSLAQSLDSMRMSLVRHVGDLQEANQTLEARVEERTADLVAANEELQSANRLIVDSIRYASRIQEAVLPSPAVLGDMAENHFLLWEPRDMVGGDFVWFDRNENREVIIVGDCTGHGVPGAFMTLIAGTMLDRIFSRANVETPSNVLRELNAGLKNILGQDHREKASVTDELTDDGLDAGICIIDRAAAKLSFAGAHISLWQADGGMIEEIKGDRFGLGYRRTPKDVSFVEHEVDLRPGRSFYLTTDGLIDQVGGDRRLSFGRRRFKAALSEHLNADMRTQGQALRAAFENYQGGETRRDDVTVLGIQPVAA